MSTNRTRLEDFTSRPILFSAPMVRALLDGSKTQTRRIVKPVRVHSDVDWMCCPYGVPGDRLWVRETWATWNSVDKLSPTEVGEIEPSERRVWYRSDGCAGSISPSGRWRPSIHMPRWASRITLEIKNVRVERLCSISEVDAHAEGLPLNNWGDLSEEYGNASYLIPNFQSLWESINGAGSWAENPFVWVLEFRRVKGGAK